MKKTLGLLLMAVTLVALVPKAAGAADTFSQNRGGLSGVTSGQGKGFMPPVGDKRPVPPVQGGSHSRAVSNGKR